jgi:TatD DNase family protein
MLIDSHCHLDFPDFSGELEALMARAQAAGVERLVTISTRVKRHAEVLAIVERFPQVCCSIGTHPHYACEELDVTVEELIAHTTPQGGRAGESGLDYHYELSPREAQARASAVISPRHGRPACW